MNEKTDKIEKKIVEVQKEVINYKCTMTGKNKYGNYEYLKLDDFLPFIFEKCYENDLFIKFNFNSDIEDKLVSNMTIFDLNSHAKMTFSLPPMVIEKLPQMNLMQSLGAYLTYARKYLLMNTFFVGGSTDLDDFNTSETESKEQESISLSEEEEKALKNVLDKLSSEYETIKRRKLVKEIEKAVEDEETSKNLILFVKKNYKAEINLKEV